MERPTPIWAKDFSKCPQCGCEKGLVDTANKELPGQEKVFGAYRKEVFPLLPIQTCLLSVPALLLQWDFCDDCGTPHITRAERVDMPITAQMKKEM